MTLSYQQHCRESSLKGPGSACERLYGKSLTFTCGLGPGVNRWTRRGELLGTMWSRSLYGRAAPFSGGAASAHT